MLCSVSDMVGVLLKSKKKSKEKIEKTQKREKKKGKKTHGCINIPWALVKWEVETGG